MSDTKAIAILSACLAVQVSVGQAHACKPGIIPVSAYLNNTIPNSIVFLGKVTLIESTTSARAITHDIKMNVTRQYHGKPHKTISVRGVTTLQASGCEVVYDFSAKVGEEWLIIGQLDGGKVTPHKFGLSEKIVNGEIPAQLRKALQ